MAPSTLLEKVWREAFFLFFSNWQLQCHPFLLSGFVPYYRKFISSQNTINIPSWQFLPFHTSNLSKLQLLTPDLHFYPAAAAAAAADLEKVSTCFCFGDTPEALGCPRVSTNVFLLSDLCFAQRKTEITRNKPSFSRIFPHFYWDVTITHSFVPEKYAYFSPVIVKQLFTCPPESVAVVCPCRKCFEPDLSGVFRLQRRRQPPHLLDEGREVHRRLGRRENPRKRHQVSRPGIQIL